MRRMLLLLALSGAGLGGSAATVRPAAPGSEAEAALLRQPIAFDPSRAWSWLAAHEAARPQQRDDQRALQRGLFDFYLRQAAGEPWPREATLLGTIVAGRDLRPVDADPVGQRLWETALARGLQPQWPAAPVALPGELESIGDRLDVLAPGLWLSRWADGRARNLIWVVRVHNVGGAALAPQDLQLAWTPAGAASQRLRCPPARGEPLVLQPDARWTLVCRGEPGLDERGSRIAEAARELAAGRTPVIRWGSTELQRPGAEHAMVQALATAAPVQTLDYARAFEPCERRGLCGQEAAAPRLRAADAGERRRASAERDTATRAKSRSTGDDALFKRPSRRQGWLAAAGLVAAFMLFCAVARWQGDRRAAIAFMVVLTPIALWLGRGQGTASVLLMPAAAFAALLLVLAFMAAYHAYDVLVFSRFDAARRQRASRPAALRRPGRRAG